jgi:NitT/TauT family transport system substrate-binding protein
LLGAIVSWGLFALSAGGCGGADAPDANPQSGAGGAATRAPAPRKIKVAYLGLTCEASMFVAQEKGFFKDEGLDVELVKTDWDGLRDGLGLGRFQANYTLIMYLLKPIEQGLDVKITGGIHTGCLRVQVGPNSGITRVEDLKGKRIGVPTHLGSPPFLFTSRVLAAHGLKPGKDVEWVVLQPDVLGLGIDKGQVDAVCDSEPIGSILAATKKLRTIADQAVDAPYKDEYCCAVVVNGKFARADPASAARVTRALLKGARWVGENQGSAAQLCVEKKYIAASAEINAQALARLKYMPGVAQCRKSLDLAAEEMKTAGLLNPSTNPSELARRAWVDLDGVSDDWVKGLQIEKVAGGGAPGALDADALSAALAAGMPATCCSLK